MWLNHVLALYWFCSTTIPFDNLVFSSSHQQQHHDSGVEQIGGGAEGDSGQDKVENGLQGLQQGDAVSGGGSRMMQEDVQSVDDDGKVDR